MSRIRPELIDPDASDRSLAADVLLRDEPEEEEEDEEEEEKEDEDENEGYSE